jgi:hypothetical protein
MQHGRLTFAAMYREEAALLNERSEFDEQSRIEGRLALLKPLGCGAHGRVFKAWDAYVGFVACKLISRGTSNEFKLMTTLHHRHIVQYLAGLLIRSFACSLSLR